MLEFPLEGFQKDGQVYTLGTALIGISANGVLPLGPEEESLVCVIAVVVQPGLDDPTIFGDVHAFTLFPKT
jgi:hypothetical protein